MSLSPQWEYLTVLVSAELLASEVLHPRSVNGQELKNWKKVDLNTFFEPTWWRSLGNDKA